MRNRKSLSTVVFVASILVLNLAVPYGGYAVVGGDSMHPTIDEGCGIVAAESWDGESSLEGKIVAFQLDYVEPSSETQIPGTDRQTITWFAHTVIDEEKEYYMNESDYYIEDSTERLRYENEYGEIHRTVTDQTVSDVKELEGEHTFIARGDNRFMADSEIIPADNVIGVIDSDKYIKFQSLNQWPCSMTN